MEYDSRVNRIACITSPKRDAHHMSVSWSHQLMRQNIRRSFTALASALLIVSGYALAAPEPNPPSNVCADGKCSASLSSASGTIKWHPGHYMSIRSRHRNPTKELPYIDAIQNEPSIQGVVVQWLWSDLETAKGSYDFSSIDVYLNKLSSLSTPKRLIIRIEERGFSSQTVSSVPAYLKNDSGYNGGEVPMANGVVARIWEAPVMDRLIALYAALAAKYDGNPLIEGISTGETAIGFSSSYPAPSTYSNAALLTQFERHVVAARSQWKHSQVFVSTNYLGSDSQMEDLIKTSVSSKATVGGPDVFTRAWVESRQRALQSDEVVRGEAGSGTDYRGNVAIKAEVQDTELGGYIATFTPTELYDVAFNINHANYIFWDRNDYAGGPVQQWATGILPLIRSVNGKTYTACPASFANGCNSK
jgi:hypothetical protein